MRNIFTLHLTHLHSDSTVSALCPFVFVQFIRDCDTWATSHLVGTHKPVTDGSHTPKSCQYTPPCCLRFSSQLSKVFTGSIKATIKVSLTETGVIFSSILWEGPDLSEQAFILSDIHVDIMDYIKPAFCTEAQACSIFITV
ncbi:hypothetical protein EI94DRAFT_1705537 [Lactarius quietus]|nr:hypothetical protein EI94DRAFT_1705537 [Lactarius quietus]